MLLIYNITQQLANYKKKLFWTKQGKVMSAEVTQSQNIVIAGNS